MGAVTYPALPTPSRRRVLRSFDQYANLVFDGCVERSVVEDKYADEDLGMQASV